MDVNFNPAAAGVAIIAIGALLILSQIISEVRVEGTTVLLKPDNRTRFMIVVIVGALIAIMGFAFLVLPSGVGRGEGAATAQQTPKATAHPRGEFIIPTNGQNISFIIPTNRQDTSGVHLSASGSVEDLSSMALLCIVRDEEWSHFAYTAHAANGEWSANVGVGPASIDRPRKFTLILVTATQSVVDALERLRQADPAKYYDYGFGKSLLTGMDPLAEVVINRVS